MSFSFLPEALQEFKEAAEHYAKCEADLDLRFIKRIHSAITEVVAAPQRWPLYRKDVRRCLVPPFPYAVLYRVAENEVMIVAIMHCHRKPGYWIDRD